MSSAGNTKLKLVSSQELDATEQRGSRRQRVLLGGKISFGDLDFALECQIRDLSKTGARISVPDAIGLPPEVSILIMREGLVCRAEVVWSEPPVHGVRIIGVDDLRVSKKPELALFRDLWQGR